MTVTNSTKYSIKDIILYSPFELRSDRRWPHNDPFIYDKQEFINKCYAEPCFDKREKALLNELSTVVNETTSSRLVNNLNDELNEIRKKRKEKNDFEKSLDTISNNPIYIRGFAGTGKTTYVNTLLYKKISQDEILSYELYDLNLSSENVTFLTYDWRCYNFTSTLNKLISVLMIKLNGILEKGLNESEEKHYKRLENILDNYYIYFFNKGVRIHTTFFKIIEEYIHKKISYAINTLDEEDETTFCKKFTIIFANTATF